jgi:hypothetical protein
LVISSTSWWLSTVACYSWKPLGNCYFGKLVVSSLVAGAKKGKKERRHLVFFFRICNL